MRVLVITPWFPSVKEPHAGIFVAEQVRILRSHADVAVIHLRFGDKHEVPRLEDGADYPLIRAVAGVSRGARGRLGRLRALWQTTVGFCRLASSARRLLVRLWGHPDIVHGHVTYPTALAAQSIAHRFRVPYVLTEHSAAYMQGATDWVWAGRLTDRIMRRAIRGSWAVIAVSTALARPLVSMRFTANVIVVPNVVRAAAVHPLPVSKPTRIAHVSIMRDAHKNITMLLDAVQRVRNRRTDFEVILIGDGPDRLQLEAIAAEHDPTHTTVRFVGSQDGASVGHFLDDCAFSVVSSRVETFCVAAAESLIRGRPVVSTRCGGPEDYLDETNGLLVANDDAQAMAEGLDWMLDHYLDYDSNAIAAAARSRFSDSAVADHLLRIYRLASTGEKS